MVNVKRTGRYRLTLRQFPKEADKPLVAARARLEIAGRSVEKPVEPGSMGAVFEIDLPAGPAELLTWLEDGKGRAGGAYFTEVEWLANPAD